MQCLKFFEQVDSNRLILKSLTRINIPAIVQKDVFLKLILNIQKNYMKSKKKKKRKMKLAVFQL